MIDAIIEDSRVNEWRRVKWFIDILATPVTRYQMIMTWDLGSYGLILLVAKNGSLSKKTKMANVPLVICLIAMDS